MIFIRFYAHFKYSGVPIYVGLRAGSHQNPCFLGWNNCFSFQVGPVWIHSPKFVNKNQVVPTVAQLLVKYWCVKNNIWERCSAIRRSYHWRERVSSQFNGTLPVIGSKGKGVQTRNEVLRNSLHRCPRPPLPGRPESGSLVCTRVWTNKLHSGGKGSGFWLKWTKQGWCACTVRLWM